jgi:DNA-binding CsgD family transcriptional regulator
VAGPAEHLVATAQSALSEARWDEARNAFLGALDVEVSGAAMFGLSEALWWLGDLGESVAWRERAFGQLRDEGDVMRAALAALYTSLDYRKQYGDVAAASGWLAHTTRLVDEHDLEPLRGWLLFASSFNSDDPIVAEDLARRAQQSASDAGDRDLELCALAQVGASLVAQGRVAEGVRCLDESMAVALALDGAPDTVVFTSCMMMTSCANCAEFARVVQWVRRTIAFTERFGCPFLYAECRIHYGVVLAATGDWPSAERELLAGLEMTQLAVPYLHRLAVANLAALRLDQGRVEEAERLIDSHEESAEIAAVLARLHLWHGRPAAAISMLRRRIAAGAGQRLEHSRLDELLGEAELAVGDVDAAKRRGATMVAEGEELSCDLITARGHRLAGRVAMADGHVDVARRSLDGALVAFVRLEMVVEAVRTRLLLAAALESAEPEVATAEARAALANADRLGATPIADEAAALLRRLGVAVSRGGPGDGTALSRREAQVLELLGEGLSNPEIAARLHLSRKTVEHHVAHVLSKLGVRNRSVAAAEAIRRSAVHRADPSRA